MSEACPWEKQARKAVCPVHSPGLGKGAREAVSRAAGRLGDPLGGADQGLFPLSHQAVALGAGERRVVSCCLQGARGKQHRPPATYRRRDCRPSHVAPRPLRAIRTPTPPWTGALHRLGERTAPSWVPSLGFSFVSGWPSQGVGLSVTLKMESWDLLRDTRGCQVCDCLPPRHPNPAGLSLGPGGHRNTCASGPVPAPSSRSLQPLGEAGPLPALYSSALVSETPQVLLAWPRDKVPSTCSQPLARYPKDALQWTAGGWPGPSDTQPRQFVHSRAVAMLHTPPHQQDPRSTHRPGHSVTQTWPLQQLGRTAPAPEAGL